MAIRPHESAQRLAARPTNRVPVRLAQISVEQTDEPQAFVCLDTRTAFFPVAFSDPAQQLEALAMALALPGGAFEHKGVAYFPARFICWLYPTLRAALERYEAWAVDVLHSVDGEFQKLPH
jgi:hypothetical protein